LEYSQRLRDFSRNVLIDGEGSVGEDLYKKAAIGGAQALGRKAGIIEVGMLADLVAIDSQDMALCALTSDQLLDGLAFAASDNVISDVWSAGRHMVKNGQHIAREAIVSNYRKAVAELLT
jgi:cytosine/adenosine deaminase-related metal-dependent hydrolase